MGLFKETVLRYGPAVTIVFLALQHIGCKNGTVDTGGLAWECFGGCFVDAYRGVAISVHHDADGGITAAAIHSGGYAWDVFGFAGRVTEQGEAVGNITLLSPEDGADDGYSHETVSNVTLELAAGETCDEGDSLHFEFSYSPGDSPLRLVFWGMRRPAEECE
jgi:hypothetical protein